MSTPLSRDRIAADQAHEASCFPSVAGMLQALEPRDPVYCIFPHVYRENTKTFLEGFPGRTLYAVKANSDPRVMQLLIEAGVRHFDCASLPEIELAHRLCPDGIRYFMVPSRIRDAARIAQQRYGVRHFMVDHADALPLLAREIDMSRAVVFARMAVHHQAAMSDLSFRFGEEPRKMPALLQAVKDSGAEPAVAFNVGSSVVDPEAYRYAISMTEKVLKELPFKIRLLDVGGGYPKNYPGFNVPGLDAYFRTVSESVRLLPLADGAEVLGEPGRALAAPGMSAVTEVLLRKEDRLFLNDGMHGIFWELRYPGHQRYPARTYRDGKPHTADEMTFTLNGPTCDSEDTLPGKVDLPKDIRPGDHIEFGGIGAYSLTGRTDFNGYFSDRIVAITSGNEHPPAIANH